MHGTRNRVARTGSHLTPRNGLVGLSWRAGHGGASYLSRPFFFGFFMAGFFVLVAFLPVFGKLTCTVADSVSSASISSTVGKTDFRPGGSAGQFVFGNPDGLAHAAQRVLGEDVVAVLAEDQADRGRVGLVAELVIDNAQIEVHLAGVFGFELAFLEVDHDKAAQLQVVEQEVDVEVAVAHL